MEGLGGDVSAIEAEPIEILPSEGDFRRAR